MSINPMIPIWLMTIICIILLVCKRKGIWPYIRQIIIIVLLFVINLRIMVPSDHIEEKEQSKDAYVLFVVDKTISMLAQDYNGDFTRLSAVKKDCEYIINEMYGAKFSMVTFDNTAKVVFPFTDNAEFAGTCVDSIYPLDDLHAKGTSINICKGVMLETLENAFDRKDGNVVLFFISDGEMNTKNTLESFSGAADYITAGAVLGYGTEEGGNMYIKPFFSDEEEPVYNSEYEIAVSKINEKNLKKLAKDMGIDYVHMKEQKNIDSVLSNIKSQVGDSYKNVKRSGQVDIYYIFVMPLALMLIYDCINYKRRV